MSTIEVQVYAQQTYDAGNNVLASVLVFSPNYFGFPSGAIYYPYAYGTQNPSATPYALFPSDAAAISYYSSDASTQILTTINTNAGTTVYTATDIESVDAPVLAALAAINMDTLADGSTYRKMTSAEKTKVDGLSTVATSGAYSDLSGTPTIPTILARSFQNTPSRSIQTVAAQANGWQLSTTRDVLINYSVLITVTASITSGQSGYVVLEICSTNSATAANWVEVARTSSSQVYTLAVALQGVQGAGNPVSAIVPAGYYARLRSVNVTGTPTYSFVSGQEVLL